MCLPYAGKGARAVSAIWREARFFFITPVAVHICLLRLLIKLSGKTNEALQVKNRTMNRDKVIYWTATVMISMVMLFSMYKMYTPDYNRLGFPYYFRTELVIAKILGLAALLLPRMPLRIKEWAYAGFGIVLVSAAVAHLGSGDPVLNSLEPAIFFAILVVSYVYLHKLNRLKLAGRREI
jgi:hypothetical protein